MTIRLSLLAMLVFLGACSDPKPESLVASGVRHLERDNPDAALIEARSALDADPELPEARLLMGRVLVEVGNPANAEIELRKALQLGQPESAVLPDLVRAMILQGQFKKAADEFGNASLKDAKSIASLKAALATVYMFLGRPAEAESAVEAALAAVPNHGGAETVKVRLLAAKGSTAEAKSLMARVLERNPKDSTAWTLQGDIRRLVDHDARAALADYRRAIELGPRKLEAHSNALTILLEQGDPKAAQEQFEKLRAIAPLHPQTKYFEARLAYQSRNFDAARAALQLTLKALPNHPEALTLSGMTEFMLGSLSQAEAKLAKALRLTPQVRATRRLLAQVQLRRGLTDEALATLRPAMESFPDGATLSLAGQAQLQAGRAREAEEFFKRAVSLNPKELSSRVALAATALGRDKGETGFKELEALSATEADTAPDLAILSARLARGELRQALGAVDQLEKKTPGSPVPIHMRGRVELSMSNAADARKSFERALAADKNYFPAQASLASLDVAEGKPEAALKRLEAVVLDDPKNAQAALALVKFKARTGASDEDVAELLTSAISANPSDPALRLELVERQLKARAFSDALSAARSAVEALPDDPKLAEVLGRAQLASGDKSQALTTFTRLSEKYPNAPGLYLRLAEVQLAGSEITQARRSLQRALAILPNYLPAQTQLASLEIAAKRFPEAIAVIREVQKQRPKEAVGFLLEGDTEAFRKNYGSALPAYRRALLIEPKSEVAEKVHQSLMRSGSLADADAFAERFAAEHPRDSRFREYLGDVNMTRGKFALAESRYREVLKLTPENPLALNNLASAMLKQNKREALAFAEKAQRLSPNMLEIQDTVATALAANGKLDRAIELQREIVQAKPGEALFRLNLARLYLGAGRKRDAQEELKALADMGDRFDGQAEVARLRKLAR